MTIRPDLPLANSVAEIRGRVGVTKLNDDDILLLAIDEIAKTTTYEEQAYGTGKSCAT